MSVDFNDERDMMKAAQRFQQNSSTGEDSFLVRTLISSGIVSTKEKANIVLLVVAAVFVTITFIVIYKMNGGGGTKVSPAQQQAIDEVMRNMRAPSGTGF